MTIEQIKRSIAICERELVRIEGLLSNPSKHTRIDSLKAYRQAIQADLWVYKSQLNKVVR